MVKPLRSEDPRPRDIQFKDFGVLDDGSQSKGAFFSSIAANIALALLAVVLGSVVKHVVAPDKAKDVTFADVKPLPKPKPPPPPKLPPPPKIKEPEPVIPKIKLPEPPVEVKMPEVKMVPVPVKLPAAPPRKVSPPPAPKVVRISPPMAASVPNHDAHPSPVRVGGLSNPLKPLTGPTVSRVNFGNAGSPGMPSSNTGSGNPTRVSIAGSGSPYGSNMNGHDNAARPVRGFGDGVPGGTGKTRNGSVSPVAIAGSFGNPPAQHTASTVADRIVASPPTVVYKPKPAYTEQAKAARIEGSVLLRIRVLASGQVEVVGVERGLGYGLDESAESAMRETRFKPAVDAQGRPIDWTGVVRVSFVMAG
jgi:protein TonB